MVMASTGMPSAESAAASSSRASGDVFHARPQPAATSPGTGIIRPPRPRRSQHSSHDIAAAVVGNVTTRDGTRTRAIARRPAGPTAAPRGSRP